MVESCPSGCSIPVLWLFYTCSMDTTHLRAYVSLLSMPTAEVGIICINLHFHNLHPCKSAKIRFAMARVLLKSPRRPMFSIRFYENEFADFFFPCEKPAAALFRLFKKGLPRRRAFGGGDRAAVLSALAALAFWVRGRRCCLQRFAGMNNLSHAPDGLTITQG